MKLAQGREIGWFGSRLPGIGLEDIGLEALRNEPALGDFKASFHCCTLLTASSYSVGFLGTTASDRFAFTIHGCFSNFRAETLRLGSFWKHCIRKSRTTLHLVRPVNTGQWVMAMGDSLEKLLQEAEDGRHSRYERGRALAATCDKVACHPIALSQCSLGSKCLRRW